MAWWNRNKSSSNDSESEEVIRMLLRDYDEAGADWLWQTDSSRRLIDPSERLAGVLKMSISEVVGIPLLKALSGDAWDTGVFPKSLQDLAEKMKRREVISNLIVPCVIDGDPRWFELSGVPRLDSRGKFLGYRGVGSDVTEQRKVAEKIAREARVDEVTGLPNFRSLAEDMGNILMTRQETGNHVGVIAFGCSNFGEIKRQVGYRNAEYILKIIAERIRLSSKNIRLFGTTAPDEMIVIYDSYEKKNDVKIFAERMSNIISSPVEMEDGREVSLNFSIGLAEARAGDYDGEAVILEALNALYSDGANSNFSALKTYSDVHGKTGGRSGKAETEDGLKAVVLEYGPAARAGVESLLVDHERRLHNRPPEALDQASLEALRQLHSELGELIELASKSKPLEKKIGKISTLSKRVFKFSMETGEIFVSGLKPLIASVPVAFGTMYLLQAVCGQELFEALGAGAAVAILGGYFSVSGNRR